LTLNISQTAKDTAILLQNANGNRIQAFDWW